MGMYNLPGMRKSLLSIILVSFIFSCNADELTISLAKRKLSGTFHGYYIEDVILGQREDSCLGYLHPYGPNKCIALYFQNNIRSELKDFLMKSLPKQADLQPVIIRVNRIFIYQVSEGVRDYSCLDLSLSFIRTGQGLVEDFTSAFNVSVAQDYFPKGLSKMIVNAIDSSFNQYDKRSKTGFIAPVVITPGQLKENPVDKPGYFNCFTGKHPGKGFYRTWFDFRDNLPDTSLAFTVIHKYNKKNPCLSRAKLTFDKGSEPEKIWGFYEDDTLYFNTGRYYSLLMPEGDLFSTYGLSSEYTKEVVSATIIGGVLFGIVGASLFGGLTAASSDLDRIEKFRLDLFNGKLLPFCAKDYTMISSGIVFYLSKVSDPRTTLGVFVDGQLQCEMKPGNYFTLDLSCHYSSANIKLVSSLGGEKLEKIPLKLFKTKMYLLKVKKNHVIAIDHLYEQVKKDILKDMTKENTVCRVEMFNK
jgi:hypothetical protein